MGRARAMKAWELLKLLVFLGSGGSFCYAQNTFPSSGPVGIGATTPVHRVSQALQLAQSVSFDSWRPYKNADRLIQVGMNKGQIIAIAGQPDYSESYYQGGEGRRTWISDWYYVRTGFNAETTLLKFVGETLVSITITPTQ